MIQDKRYLNWKKEIKKHLIKSLNSEMSKTIVKLSLFGIGSNYGIEERNKVVDEFNLEKYGFKKK